MYKRLDYWQTKTGKDKDTQGNLPLERDRGEAFELYKRLDYWQTKTGKDKDIHQQVPVLEGLLLHCQIQLLTQKWLRIPQTENIGSCKDLPNQLSNPRGKPSLTPASLYSCICICPSNFPTCLLRGGRQPLPPASPNSEERPTPLEPIGAHKLLIGERTPTKTCSANVSFYR